MTGPIVWGCAGFVNAWKCAKTALYKLIRMLGMSLSRRFFCALSRLTLRELAG